MCVKRMLYCPGSGQELLSAFGVTMECHDSSVFLIRKLPLSITEALLKSMEWSWDHLVESSESRKSFASLPYIKGVTEPLTRVLK